MPTLHSFLLYAFITLLVLTGILTLTQIWFPLFGWDIFFKLIASIVIIGIILGLLIALKADLGQHKKMKDDNYLD